MDRSEPVYYVQVQPEGSSEAQRIDLSSRVVAFTFEDSEKKADLLKLTVDNQDLSNFDDPVWRNGNKLIVAWGYFGNMAPPRECIIQKVTGALMLTVEAQAKSVLMNKVTKNRVFDAMTRSDVVKEIAKENGYEGPTADVEETDVTYPQITQARLTDAQFIKRLADLEGFEFFVDFDGFHWHRRRVGQAPLRVLQWYMPPAVGDIISFNVENDVFAKPGAAVAKGRDPVKKQDIEGKGSAATTERDTTAPAPEIIDPKTGELTVGKNVASEATAPTTETSPQAAKREADGVYRRAQQTTVDLTIEMVGDPQIVAKSVVDVRGIGKRLSGLYYVKQANHKLDGNGYTLSLKCSTDGTHGHQELIAGGAVSGSAGGSVPKGGVVTQAQCDACRQQAAQKREELAAVTTGTDINLTKAKQLEAELAAIEKKCAALEGQISKGKVNDKGGGTEGKDPAVLEPQEVIDPKTGETTIVYVDKKGRAGSDGEQVK